MPIAYSRTEIKQLFQTELRPKLKTLDKERKSIRNFIISFIFVFICIIGYLSSLQKNETPKQLNELESILIPAFFICFVIGAFLFKKKKNQFVTKYKSIINKEIFNALLPQATYFPSQKISESIYNASCLVTDTYNVYNGDDLTSATYNNTTFSFSDLHTRYVRGSGKNKTDVTRFKGIFLTADLNLDLKSNMVVVPDAAEKFFGKSLGQFFQKHTSNRGELIKLENPIFEKKFVTYGTDQIEARRILTPIIMEKLLRYNRKSYRDIYLSFQNNQFYMAVPMNNNLFEPKIFGITKLRDIARICSIIQMLTEIIDHLEHLNQDN